MHPTTIHDTGWRVEAAERLAAYFRSLGLVDRAALSAAVGRTLEGVESDWAPAHEEALLRKAIEDAMRSVAAWLDSIVANEVLAHPDQARALIWAYLPGLLRAHPEAFLERKALPPAFRRALHQADLGVVPDWAFTPMEPQLLGRMPRMLRRNYWSRMGRLLRGAPERALRALTRR
jgi:hypothetical protein